MLKSISRVIRNIAFLIFAPFQLAYHITVGTTKLILKWMLELLTAFVYPIRHLKSSFQATKTKQSTVTHPAKGEPTPIATQTELTTALSSIIQEALQHQRIQIETLIDNKVEYYHLETRRIIEELLQQSVNQVTSPHRVAPHSQPSASLLLRTSEIPPPEAPIRPQFLINAAALYPAAESRPLLMFSQRNLVLRNLSNNLNPGSFLGAALHNQFKSVNVSESP
jgi:hypothetical protein